MSVTVADLLKLPAMRGSYIVSGARGIHNIVKRVDILDMPYPDVVPYIEPDDFTLATFWNSRLSKEARVKYVEVSAAKKCAGLAIMPDICLNGIIDDEIIRLGEVFSFPIVYLPNNLRYVDIILGFGRLNWADSYNEKNDILCEANFALKKIFISRDRLRRSGNIGKFTEELSDILGVDVGIKMGDKFFYSGSAKTSHYVDSFLCSFMENPFGDRLLYPVVENFYIDLARGIHSIVGFVFNESQMEILDIISIIKPIIVETLDEILLNIASNSEINGVPNDSGRGEPLSGDDMVYLAVIKNPSSIHDFVCFCANHGVEIVNFIPQIRTYILAIPICSEVDNENEIYSFYREILSKLNPELLVFSDKGRSRRSIQNECELLTLQLGEMGWLKGLVNETEIPILYSLTLTPMNVKRLYIKNFKDLIGTKISCSPEDLTTIRLYLAIKSTKKVGQLLGIHFNTVKYRIQKMLCNGNISEEASFLNSIPVLSCLLGVELIYLEPGLSQN